MYSSDFFLTFSQINHMCEHKIHRNRQEFHIVLVKNMLCTEMRTQERETREKKLLSNLHANKSYFVWTCLYVVRVEMKMETSNAMNSKKNIQIDFSNQKWMRKKRVKKILLKIEMAKKQIFQVRIVWVVVSPIFVDCIFHCVVLRLHFFFIYLSISFFVRF